MSTPFARDSRLVLAALRAGYPITVAALAAATLLTTFRVIDLLAVLTAKGEVAEATVKVYSLPQAEPTVSVEDTIAIIRRDSAAALLDNPVGYRIAGPEEIALARAGLIETNETAKQAVVNRASEASNTRGARV